MSKHAKKQEKLARPHAHFEEPKDVLTDGSLSKKQKLEVLESLEQDARRLDESADEGMVGGEPHKLEEVLEAKDALTDSDKPKP
jgi:hypothetical protein